MGNSALAGIHISEAHGDMTGAVILVFPVTGTNPKFCVPGWSFRIRDAETGEPINTVTELALYAKADDLAWARFTMFVDQNGNPVYDGIPPMWQEEGEPEPVPHLNTFNFLIAGVTVEPLVKSDTKGVSDDQLELPFDQG